MDIIDAKPTTEEVETLREDMAEMYERSASAERTYASQRVDTLVAERDAYAKQVETLTAERDAARARADVYTKVLDDVTAFTGAVHEELLQAREQLRNALADTAVAIKERDLAKHDAAKFCQAWQAELDATQAELEQARQAADEWATMAREYEHLLGIWRPDNGPLVRTNAVVAQPPMPCPRSKAKQFGPATFVVRRCKLQDGHDGQCEPA